MSRTFTVASVAIIRRGHVLTVRHHGAVHWQLPGGKIEPGESPATAAAREVLEETGLELAGDVTPLGRFHNVAASDPRARVDAYVFVADAVGEPAARAEIADVRWHALDDDGPRLAPVLGSQVIPRLLVEGRER